MVKIKVEMSLYTCSYKGSVFIAQYIPNWGHAVTQLVEALRYV